METKKYSVKTVEGEYAYLMNIDNPTEEPLFIAMALLPMGTDVGTLLLYRDLEFSICE